jgi:hypothetical protein
MPEATPVAGSSSFTQTDLPAWYQAYTQNLGTQAMGLAQANNMQPLPAQSVAGFNADQTGAFDQVRQNQGLWRQNIDNATGLVNQIAPTAAKFVDYAQGAVGGPAQTTGEAVQPWAQGAQDALSGSAQGWTDPGTVQKYMSPYTQQVVDNVARLGQRNWQDTIMPGVNSSMIGSGQFGSTRNADILTRAGVNAANDITGQQSTALQAGYNSGAAIFGQDANRAQQQQKLQSDAALSGGNLMQGALSADANRIQQQGQLQANTALQGATTATSAMKTGADALGALSQTHQALANTDAQSMLNIGKIQQDHQQSALAAAYNNAMAARQDPWTQLSNAAGIVNGVRLPGTTAVASSGAQPVQPNLPQTLGSALLTGASLL